MVKSATRPSPHPPAPPWRLVGVGHGGKIEIEPGTPTVVGRGAESGAVIPDVTVSRRHAELRATETGVAVRDLGSSNGTSINGSRVSAGDLIPGDTIVFGKIVYRLLPREPERPVTDAAPEGIRVHPVVLAPDADQSLESRQLARILDLARRLSGEFELDKLIAAVVDLTFDLLPVDRVSLLLLDEASGELVAARSKSRLDEHAGLRVPRAIARRAVTDRTPILTEDALTDARFASGSVQLQSVRAAICSPLMASKDRVLGVLYVDTLTAERSFREDEARMLFAFAGLAAVSLGKLAYAEEHRREATVRGNFERFFAPGVAARIAREQGSIALAGERRPAAVLFADIRGFTGLAETMAPELLGALLTEYFTEMADLVFEHGGTLDKFIGDAVLAVWGAPLGAPDDADRALAAAVAMQSRMPALDARWRARGLGPLAIGIGINYGEVFAGYLGSERRMEYSVIGDTVNVASRLCGDAERGEIRVAGPFVDRLSTRPILTRVPDVELKGKRHPVPVFRVERQAVPNR